MKKDFGTTALLLWLLLLGNAKAFTTPSLGLWRRSTTTPAKTKNLRLSSSTSDELATFAASLQEEKEEQDKRGTAANKKASTTNNTNTKSWQDDLDKLLDPTTPFAKRQILLQDLLSANEEIRSAVQAALRDRKIDPLLTPRSKRLQEGSRAVARQLTTDILPLLMPQPRRSSSTPSNGFASSAGAIDIPKVSNRIFNALANQVQSNLQTLQQDLANPRRIPARITQQQSTLLQEAMNVFAETPAGLKEPPYTVIRTTPDYEIRDYAAYTAVSTSMVDVDDIGSGSSSSSSSGSSSSGSSSSTVMSPALQGAAFNSLAAYIFGANRQQAVLNMTTPVTTTMSGEMRFYLDVDNNDASSADKSSRSNIPEPLEQDEARSVYETDRIFIQEIPPCRLAVRRFPGFATAGEVSRQKKSLLAALALDDVELDVPHGAAVSHVVFQYNPPYTLPVVRRNEIAVAVLDETSKVEAALQQTTPEDAWKDNDSNEPSRQ